jgi:hypothetical protein
MKPIKFLPIVMIAAAGLVASCATSKLAQTKPADDVYNSVAKAREVEVVLPAQNQQAQVQNRGQEEYDEYYGTSNPYYDMDYSSRINRFYNGYSFQGYYDPYFDNYYYGNSYENSNYLGYGLGWNNGYGLGGWGGGFGGGFGYGSIWSNPFYYGNSGYGWNNPYGWNSWGPNSYYDRYGWGGGYYGGGGWGIGGGYYGGNGGVYTNRGYNRPRPGSDDRGTPKYGNGNGGNVGRPSRSGVANQNGGISYAPNNNAGRPARTQTGGYAQGQNNQSGRPTRNDNYSPQQGTQSSRPTRNENYTPQQPARTESRPTYSPPPSNGGGGGGGSTGGGGGGGGSRPSRAGRG